MEAQDHTQTSRGVHGDRRDSRRNKMFRSVRKSFVLDDLFLEFYPQAISYSPRNSPVSFSETRRSVPFANGALADGLGILSHFQVLDFVVDLAVSTSFLITTFAHENGTVMVTDTADAPLPPPPFTPVSLVIP